MNSPQIRPPRLIRQPVSWLSKCWADAFSPPHQSSNEKFLKTLRRTRQLIARINGWHKGSFKRKRIWLGGYSYCLVGALEQAALESNIIRENGDFTTMRELISRQEPINTTFFASLAAFNDQPNTTKADILRVLDVAIAKLA